MKLQILQEDLAKATSVCSRFVNNKAQLPILSNILLETNKTKLRLAATNLEMSVSVSIGAKIEEEGNIAVPSRILSELVANLTPGQMYLSQEKERLRVESQNYKSEILGMNTSEFPLVPGSLGEKKWESLSSILVPALEKTLFSVSTDDTRAALTGVLFKLNENSCSLVSTDGFRLSLVQIKDLGLSVSEAVNFIVPKNILAEVVRVPSDEKIYLEHVSEDNQLVVENGNVVLSSRIIEGSFPSYEKIIPKSSATKINCDKDDLKRVVKLASVFAHESANVVQFVVDREGFKITSESGKSGRQTSQLEAKVEGEETQVSFNYRFVEEFLGSVQGSEISIELGGANLPGVFKDIKDESYLHLIMPVKA